MAFRGTTGWLGDFARINTILGDKKKGIAYFKQLNDEHGMDMAWMRIDPYLDEVGNEPEFKKIVAAIEQRNIDMLRQIKEDEKKKFSLDF